MKTLTKLEVVLEMIPVKMKVGSYEDNIINKVTTPTQKPRKQKNPNIA